MHAEPQTLRSVSLANKNGVRVDLLNLGARISALWLPSKSSGNDCVVTAYEKPEEFLQDRAYFGCIAGRVANRINQGRFSLEGKPYQLAVNNGRNHLHGGLKGFDQQFWDMKQLSELSLRFSRVSQHLEEGYPAKLSLQVIYTLNQDNELTIEYHAHSEATTIINLTNHAYFNLRGAGRGSVLQHELQLNAKFYTPVDEQQIPTGEVLSVRGTPFDFLAAKPLGQDIEATGTGYDHNFVLDQTHSGACAILKDPESGRSLEVESTQPGLQLYTANFFNGSISGIGGFYQRHGAVCLENQHFPDSINHSHFPTTVLTPEADYWQRTCWRFAW